MLGILYTIIAGVVFGILLSAWDDLLYTWNKISDSGSFGMVLVMLVLAIIWPITLGIVFGAKLFNN